MMRMLKRSYLRLKIIGIVYKNLGRYKKYKGKKC